MTRAIWTRAIAAGRAIGLYAAGGLATGVVGFVALPVFTRLFTPEEFGVIGLFTAAVGLLTPILSLGGYVFVLVDPRGKSHSSGVVGATVIVASVGAAALVTIVAIANLVGLIDNVSWGLVTLSFAASWGNVWVALRLHIHQRNQQPGRYFAVSSIPPVAGFLLTVTLAPFLGGWAPRIGAITIVAIGAAAWSGWSINRSSPVTLKASRDRLREVVRFGAPLIVHTGSIWVIGFTDRFIVAEREGLTAAGIYTVAYSIGLGFSALHEGVSRYFVSRLPEWVTTSTGQRNAARFAYIYAAGAVAALPVLVPLAVVGLGVLATDAFSGGSKLLYWLVPAQSFAGIARVFTGYLYVESRTRARATLSAAEALLNIALTWILVGRLGIAGAAIATLLTYTVSMVGTFALARSGRMLAALGEVRRS